MSESKKSSNFFRTCSSVPAAAEMSRDRAFARSARSCAIAVLNFCRPDHGKRFAIMSCCAGIGSGNQFSLDLIAHEADWRGAMRWETSAYPEYFNATSPLADEIAGTGAYSLYEGDLDAEKMRRMAFRTNWKASYDFPYPGMFLPPVDDTRVWNRFSDDPRAADPDAEQAPNGRTSIPQMADTVPLSLRSNAACVPKRCVS